MEPATSKTDPRMHQRKLERHAFTLVELLTVMAVISVLAALASGAISGMRKKADRLAAISNLRQIGAAIQAYSAEHDNLLPGPIFPGQVASYWDQKPERLTAKLAPYLGVDPSFDKNAFLPVFA